MSSRAPVYHHSGLGKKAKRMEMPRDLHCVPCAIHPRIHSLLSQSLTTQSIGIRSQSRLASPGFHTPVHNFIMHNYLKLFISLHTEPRFTFSPCHTFVRCCFSMCYWTERVVSLTSMLRVLCILVCLSCCFSFFLFV